jgi:hypothetical protein
MGHSDAPSQVNPGTLDLAFNILANRSAVGTKNSEHRQQIISRSERGARTLSTRNHPLSPLAYSWCVFPYRRREHTIVDEAFSDSLACFGSVLLAAIEIGMDDARDIESLSSEFQFVKVVRLKSRIADRQIQREQQD